MNKKLWKLIWFGVPLTKVVYAYLAYTSRKEIDNSFQILSLLILLIGILTCTISILISRKIYKKSFYDNKIVKALMGSQIKSDDASTIFYLFTMLLSLAEAAAVFGFVQYIITGNLIVGIILYAFSLLAWAFNYPSVKENDDEQ
ncbi:MAG: hypothetical protein K6C97_06310 [Treponema sp.]|nr:hypothetical protein [Treponema sp.]